MTNYPTIERRGQAAAVAADSGWSDPRSLMLYPNQKKALAVDMAVSPAGNEFYFLGQHPHQHSREAPGLDLWVSYRVAGEWSTAQVVPPPVTTSATESYPTAVADGSYLIFASSRPGGFGQGDLYVSFRQADGSWGEGVNLGKCINTDQMDFCPMVTPDGKYLFFSRRWGASWDATTAGDVYWVDVRVLDQFRR